MLTGRQVLKGRQRAPHEHRVTLQTCERDRGDCLRLLTMHNR